MVYTNVRHCLLAACALLVTACSDGRSVSNAAPRVSDIPQQATNGGSTFSLDLSDYVTDRESPTLTYTVTSGGGSFTDSTYSNTFDSIGEYDVTFSVTDGPKTNTGTFRVMVTSANLIAVSEDARSMLVLDTATNALTRVTSSQPQPFFRDTVGTRNFIYRLGINSASLLHDTYTGGSTTLAADIDGGATYQTKTSDGNVIYTTGAAPDMTLWSYNPTTGLARDIADGGLSTFSVLVNTNDLVFYEDGVDGQADIYYYDPAEDEVVLISDAATDEQLLAVLPDGGAVFSRLGDSGETDLFYYRVGIGLAEIGLDVTALATRNKTFQTNGTNNKVVFTALNSSDEELFFWNPETGQTTTIASGVNTTVFAEVGTGNEVAYNIIASSTEHDAYYYDLDDGTNATLRNDSDQSTISQIVSDGTTSWALIRPSGATDTKLAISMVASPSMQTWNAGGTVFAGGELSNGDYVEERADGTALNVFDVSAGTWGTAITGTGLAFEGAGLEDGDFVYSFDASGQDDLSMWDASASASVPITTDTGDEGFERRTLDSTILFTRIVGTNTTRDLFAWDGTTITRITDQDSAGTFHDYVTIGNAFAVTK